MEDATIPYSNCSQSIKDSWFVSFSTLVPTKNAKLLTPLRTLSVCNREPTQMIMSKHARITHVRY